MNRLSHSAFGVERVHDLLELLTDVARLQSDGSRQPGGHDGAGTEDLVLTAQELEALPGVVVNTYDADGPIWLAIELAASAKPPPLDVDLHGWVSVSSNPDRSPVIADRNIITVSESEKDFLISSGRASLDSFRAVEPDTRALPAFTLSIEPTDRPDIVERIDRYVTGVWAAWADAERRVRRNLEIHRRLRDIGAQVRTSFHGEVVWGLVGLTEGNAGHPVSLPLIEHPIDIEVSDRADGEIRVRPCLAGPRINRDAIAMLRPDKSEMLCEAAGRMLDALSQSGELSPFKTNDLAPVVTFVASQLHHEATAAGNDELASSTAIDTDRWVLRARPRAMFPALRDVELLRQARMRAGGGRCCLSSMADVLLGAFPRAPRGRQLRLSRNIGEPVVSTSQPEADAADLFFPFPSQPGLAAVVRQLAVSDGAMLDTAKGGQRTLAIANLICHYLAMGMRVLVVSSRNDALLGLYETVPQTVRDFTTCLIGSDDAVLRKAGALAARLQSQLNRDDLQDSVTEISRLERNVVTTHSELAQLDDEIGDLVSDDLRDVIGAAETEKPYEALTKLLSGGHDHTWFADRPSRIIGPQDPLVVAVVAAQEARRRTADKLRHLAETLPDITCLPDGRAVARLHQDLLGSCSPENGGGDGEELAHRAIALMGASGAGRLAEDIEALIAARRVLLDEPWLTRVSPLADDEGESDRASIIISWARAASLLVARRAELGARAVDVPDEALDDDALIDAVDRLSAGDQGLAVSLSLGRRSRRSLKTIRIAGRPPAEVADWVSVRDHLVWRRDFRELHATWRSLARELGAPPLDGDLVVTAETLERIARFIEVGVVSAAMAIRRVRKALSVLVISDDMLEDTKQLGKLGEALRATLARMSARQRELTGLKELFSGEGELAVAGRVDILSRIGVDDIPPCEIERRWDALRDRIRALSDCGPDFEFIEAAAVMAAERGAPAFARLLRSEPARSDRDPVLDRDWRMAWNHAVLMQAGVLDRHRLLAELSTQRAQLEKRSGELMGEVIGARMRFALMQSKGEQARARCLSLPTQCESLRAPIPDRRRAVSGSRHARRYRRASRTSLVTCFRAGVSPSCWRPRSAASICSSWMARLNRTWMGSWRCRAPGRSCSLITTSGHSWMARSVSNAGSRRVAEICRGCLPS
ncbi:hypothetical protein LQG66_25810 [Bradyrhizobium ontarionense]|uniref:DNA2/NAM7 helicase helicase domain-containing protein n=1 Tax=Bradyrhizobium ontarionense TaxID=2898149 RepID=A0ABY3R6J6_9BRAD|nr:hypothetical protein [Bradyrhizobium sp. A19]UFZ02672.1 hypothetical protein LQG66_25810 [Bradyrhizobium sp. A19]